MRKRGFCCACSVTTSGCCPSFLLSQCARKELTNSRRGLSSETSKKELRDLWPVEPVLAAKRNNALQPHIVFLEGGAGTGKGDILWRLKKIGYKTVSLPFITGILAEGSRSAPNHHLTHVSWLHLLIDELDRYRKVRILTEFTGILTYFFSTSNARTTLCLFQGARCLVSFALQLIATHEGRAMPCFITPSQQRLSNHTMLRWLCANPISSALRND